MSQSQHLYSAILSVLQADEQARRRFTDNDDNVQYLLVSFLGNIANRYFYTKTDPDDYGGPLVKTTV